MDETKERYLTGGSAVSTAASVRVCQLKRKTCTCQRTLTVVPTGMVVLVLNVCEARDTRASFSLPPFLAALLRTPISSGEHHLLELHERYSMFSLCHPSVDFA